MSPYLMVFALIILLVPGTGSANPEMTFVLPGDAEIEMVWIEPGTFTMGTTEEQEQWLQSKGMWGDWGDTAEQPAHQVSISRGFYLGKFEVTNGQWASVMGGTTTAPDTPKTSISWDDVQEFIATLNQAEGSEVYRLPTDAEWEYASRAGTTTLWSFGDDPNLVGEYAWYTKNAWSVGLKYAQPVGMKLPNPWGLYGMHGNLWEWCQDWFAPYASDSQVDPTGPATGTYRVGRSGCYADYATPTRSAGRFRQSPGYRADHNGVRLLRIGPALGLTPVSPGSWGGIKAKLGE